MQLSINSYYTFLTRAPGILGAKFTNLKLMSVMTYDMAKRFIDVQAQHANIYPVLPDGVADNPANYTYYLFKTESNQDLVLADVWIETSSIAEKSAQSLMVEINTVSNTDITRISTLLTTMGFKFTTRII